MLDFQQTQKNFKDIISFFSQYAIIIFNYKKRLEYILKYPNQKIITHIILLIGISTAILHGISIFYKIDKPLPIIYLPIYILIFSFFYIFLNILY